jgi:hypothetical protein
MVNACVLVAGDRMSQEQILTYFVMNVGEEKNDEQSQRQHV